MRIKGLFIWEWLFLPFLFLLPWQTRLILRPGILNGGNWEYGIIGVYGTEILLWVVFLFWLVGENKNFNAFNVFKVFKGIKDIKSRQFLLFLISLIFLVSLSILAADDRMIAWQSWRYIFEAIIVFFLIRRHSRPGWLTGAFLSGLAIQSVLGIGQFLAQSTLASRWLGLTVHPAWQAGSAVLENTVGRWLRAYGGLPHPNIFGGYLVVGLILIVTLLHYHIVRRRSGVLLLTIYCLLLTALFFTFSRSAWLACFIGLLFYFFIIVKNKKYLISNIQYLISPIILFVVFAFLFSPLLTTRLSGTDRLEVQSTSERLSGYGEARRLFQKYPLFGVGLGNYTLAVRNEINPNRSAWTYQPAHNIFVLMTSELGIIGMALLIILLFLVAKNINNIQYPISNILILFFILGFFDHYLWSLYSGWMLLAVGFGLSLANSKEVC